MLLVSALCALLQACGGGDAGLAEPTGPTTSAAVASTDQRQALRVAGTTAAPRASTASSPAATTEPVPPEEDPGAVSPATPPGTLPVPVPIAPGPIFIKVVAAGGDATQPPASLAAAASMTGLAYVTPDPAAGLRAVRATPLCRQGFVPPADLQRSTAADLPANGGVFFTSLEQSTWRTRITSGPFVNDGDFVPGSPGDWSRIKANAERFQRDGEALVAGDDAARSTHGGLARDAAFHFLLTGSTASLSAVRRWLLAQAEAPGNDFATTRCYTGLDGGSRDGWWAEAPWLARLAATYDYARAGLTFSERVTLENYLRRQAWFFAAHLDVQLRELFPQRLAGNYGLLGRDAASTGDARWAMSRVDTNGDCRIDDADPAAAFPVYAYARADGTLGPRVAVLALWFNNRRAANAFAAGMVGVLLGDSELVSRAKRYYMEWMSYAVYRDGSTGEWGRNGDYCIAKQGLVYGSMELGGGLMLARALARQGDRTLANFSTTAGLHGSESAGGAAKSLTLLADTYLKVTTGQLDWYQAEPQKTRQEPRAATRLSTMAVRYLNGSPMDDFHELTLLPSAAMLPTLPVASTLLRQDSASSLPWPGRGGNPVATGYLGWSDAWGIQPAAYLLRP